MKRNLTKHILLTLFLLTVLISLALVRILGFVRENGMREELQMSIGNPANADGATLPMASSSNVSPKGDLAFCGRSLYHGIPIYFVVKHRNYTGPEDKIIRGPVFLNEDDVGLYVKGIDPGLRIERCPCGCWKSLGNEHHFVTSWDWR